MRYEIISIHSLVQFGIIQLSYSALQNEMETADEAISVEPARARILRFLRTQSSGVHSFSAKVYVIRLYTCR